MNRVFRVPSFAILVFVSFFCFCSFEAGAKSRKKEESNVATAGMQWTKNRKLTWDDFRGPVPHDAEEQTAAATFCGIGFETNEISNKQPNVRIKVYNTFYPASSWVRAEERNSDILAHEQGHFDLCELYTRKLRERMAEVQVDVHTLRPVLKNIYEQVHAEYTRRQQEYETETAHGINQEEQQRWQQLLEKELDQTESWSEG